MHVVGCAVAPFLPPPAPHCAHVSAADTQRLHNAYLDATGQLPPAPRLLQEQVDGERDHVAHERDGVDGADRRLHPEALHAAVRIAIVAQQLLVVVRRHGVYRDGTGRCVVVWCACVMCVSVLG